MLLICDTEINKSTNQSNSSEAGTAKMDWSCHQNVWRAATKESLRWRIQVGKRFQGYQTQRYKGAIKASLKDFNISLESNLYRLIVQNDVALSERDKTSMNRENIQGWTRA